MEHYRKEIYFFIAPAVFFLLLSAHSCNKKSDQASKDAISPVAVKFQQERAIGHHIDSLVYMAYSDPDSVAGVIPELEQQIWSAGLERSERLSGKVTYLKAMVENIKGNYQTSHQYARDAAGIFRSVGDSVSMYNAWSTMGALHMYLSNYDSAQYYLINAYNYFIRNDLPEYIIKTCINLSGTYYYAGEPGISMNYLRESLREHLRYTSPLTLSRTYLNMGIIMADQGKTADARDTLKLALKLATPRGDVPVITDCLNRLALLEIREGNFGLALQYYSELIEASSKWSDRFIEGEALLHISAVYDSLVQTDRALEFATESYNLAGEIGSRDLLARSARKLGELSAGRGAYRKANLFLNEFLDLNSEILNETKTKQLIEIETRYQTQHKEEENRRLLLQNEINNLKLSRTRILLMLLLILTVLLVLAAVLMIKQNNIRAFQNRIELEQRLFRLQLNPHFMFNALSTIQSCNNRNQHDLATQLLYGFARLMRLILESSEKELISITEELEMIRLYLDIQQNRFPGLFDYTIDLQQEVEEEVRVPPMLLQPFTENAIEHGLRPLENGGQIEIVIRLKDGRLMMELSDNGVGRKIASEKTPFRHESMATVITQRRFENLKKKYRKKFVFSITDLYDQNGGSAGTRVLFEIPGNL